MGVSAQSSVTYPMQRPTSSGVLRERPAPAPRAPRLLDRVREALRAGHGSRRTEKASVGWIRRVILFHGKRHPLEMGAAEVTRFLSALAVEGQVHVSGSRLARRAQGSRSDILDLRIARGRHVL